DEDSPRYYVPTTRPGHRLPHAWMADGRSTLDLLGRGFVLIRTNTSLDVEQFETCAKRAGMPLTVVDIESPEIAKLYERALVLVRPDGHCAWRGDSAPENPKQVIDIVRGCASQVVRSAAEAMH